MLNPKPPLRFVMKMRTKSGFSFPFAASAAACVAAGLGLLIAPTAPAGEREPDSVHEAAPAEPVLPGFVYEDGRWVLDEPVREGRPRATGLQLPYPPMPGLEANPITPEKVELGRLLFYDPVLSGSNRLSCATCHHPDHGFSDGRPRSIGAGGEGIGPDRTGGEELERNAPTLWNAALHQSLFWDGRAATLEEQALVPLTSPREMNEDPARLVRELRAIPEYAQLFGEAFGGGADAVTIHNVAAALATFQRTLISINSKFDRYATGDFAAFNESEKRGLMLFRSLHTRCFECHNFPNFSDETFRVLGVPEDARDLASMDRGRGAVAETGPEFGFKVPTLRNVALTAPYMHNGSLATLREVIDFYSDAGGRKEEVAVPLIDEKIHTIDLTDQESEDLVAFLETLTDTSLQPPAPERVPSGLPVVEVSEAARRGGSAWQRLHEPPADSMASAGDGKSPAAGP